MNVRCKFRCETIEAIEHSDLKLVSMTAQWDPKIPEDERFTGATPSGKLVVQIGNPAALAALEAGKYYFLDLSPA